MNDESFSRRMRALDHPETPDPAFVDGLYRDLAAELGFAAPTSAGVQPTPKIPRSRRRRRSWPLLAVAALLLTLGLGALVATGGLRGPSTDDLLARLQALGWMRVAISREHPQVVLPGAPAAGFDVELARALSQRLALPLEPIAYTPGSPGSLLDRADVAMSATDALGWQEAGWSLVEPAYHWVRHLLVRADAPFADPADLAGRTVGVPTSEEAASLLPEGAVALSVAGDHDCLQLLEAGGIEACLTTVLGPTDLAARPALKLLGAPVAIEPRGPMVRASDDTRRFEAAVRDAIVRLRDDGTLTELSRRFLGSDLTLPPKDS